ncbi:hypothetical protein KSP40_PGU002365 [Platanthera guangdongensis]|uniref:Tetrapyrrole methylase domain-containing protein n=1 Tax=Platanthera guangdongensis TaxID=2320717 RepID=A0ABR2LY09_9ASPA
MGHGGCMVGRRPKGSVEGPVVRPKVPVRGPAMRPKNRVVRPRGRAALRSPDSSAQSYGLTASRQCVAAHMGVRGRVSMAPCGCAAPLLGARGLGAPCLGACGRAMSAAARSGWFVVGGLRRASSRAVTRLWHEWKKSPQSSVPLSTPRVCDKENEIVVQLPELKRLLETLKAARRAGGGGGQGGRPGIVALVGTGPDDPELLTLKAVRAIERVDLILYDRLVSNDVLNLVRGNVRLLYVDKIVGYHSRTQEINELLLNIVEVGVNV